MTSARELLPFDASGRRHLEVAFVGTHGVGNTTLCFDLAPTNLVRLYTLPLSSEKVA